MSLPTDFDGHSFAFIDTPEGLDRFIAEELPRIEGQPIAMDIEEDREHHYLPRIALIQVTYEDRDFVIDPVELGASAVAPAVEALCLIPSAVVMHGARNDVTSLKRDYGVGPGALHDTQFAARFIGRKRFGLASLLEEEFNIELDKGMRRSNWVRRPLSERQILYARADTTWLLPLWRRLYDGVVAAGWEDAYLEECEIQASLPAEFAGYDPTGWTRLKGIRRADDATQRRAAALWRWRDEIGEIEDQHPSRILPPWALLQLAERGARSVRRRSVPGLSNALLERYRDRLEQLLDEPPPVPEDEPRASGNGRSDFPLRIVKKRVDALTSWRQVEAKTCGLDSGFFAPRSVLESVARSDLQSLAELEATPEVRRWQATRYGETWLEVLDEGRED